MSAPKKPRVLLMSHGLFWRPNAKGYTGVKAEAGRFWLDDLGQIPEDVKVLLEEEAPEFSWGCDPSVMREVKRRQLSAELCTANKALRAAKRELRRLARKACASHALEAEWRKPRATCREIRYKDEQGRPAGRLARTAWCDPCRAAAALEKIEKWEASR